MNLTDIQNSLISKTFVSGIAITIFHRRIVSESVDDKFTRNGFHLSSVIKE